VARSSYEAPVFFERRPILAGKKTTILQIIPELDTGGAELSTVEIAGAIVRAGGRALVASEGGRLAPKIEELGGELKPFPASAKNPLRILLNAFRLARLIEREGVDLVHARSRAPAWSALIAARRTKRPFVTTYHGAYGEKNGLKRAYNSVMARGDVVIANSFYTADLIRSRYGTDTEKLRVIQRGVDGAEFDPEAISPGRDAAMRAKWALGPDDTVILHAARLTGWKGQRVVIEAASLLEREQRLGRAVFILAGEAQGRDGYLAELEHLVAAHGLEKRVRLVGHVDDMPAAFHLARLAIVASTEPEAFGRAATEAQAMGCPVVATRHGAPPETILAAPAVAAEETTGWLVPPGDAAALAAAVAEGLALSDEERGRMGARARAHVLKSFTLETMRRETLAVYDRLLGTALAVR
jgi:glycosyltransferase involved in cell wall biosynthesis